MNFVQMICNILKPTSILKLFPDAGSSNPLRSRLIYFTIVSPRDLSLGTHALSPYLALH